MFRTACFAGALALMTSAAVAKTPVDWSGWHAGLSLGQERSETSLGGYGMTLEMDHDAQALLLGYRRAFGAWVLGGELAYGRVEVKGMGEPARIDAGLQLGYAVGRVLPYVSAGVSRLELDQGHERGSFVGLGLDVALSAQWTLGMEGRRSFLAEDFMGIPGADMEADSLALRVTFRF